MPTSLRFSPRTAGLLYALAGMALAAALMARGAPPQAVSASLVGMPLGMVAARGLARLFDGAERNPRQLRGALLLQMSLIGLCALLIERAALAPYAGGFLLSLGLNCLFNAVQGREG